MPNEKEFAREYFRQYQRAGEIALLRYGTKSNVEKQVKVIVDSFLCRSEAEDKSLLMLAVAHFLEVHVMKRGL
jgi:hypothetical protein